MRIYISLPISGHNLSERIVEANRIADIINALGHHAVNPLHGPAAPTWANEAEQYAFYMGEDLKELLMCHAVYFAPGWQTSRGCRLEHAAAEIYGFEIFYDLDKIPQSE